MSNRIFIALVAYITILITWTVVRAISGDATMFVLGLNYIGVWLFTPLLFFIPWAVLKRDKLGRMLLVLPIGLFIWFFGLMFVPRGENYDNSQFPFSLMTFNIQESNSDLDAFLLILESNQAEVLALQEVSGSIEMALNVALLDKYPYHVYNRQIGLAVYSHYPILEYQVYPAQSRQFQSLTLDIEGSKVHLINAHLANTGLLIFFETGDLGMIKDSAMARVEQITRIMNVIESKGLPSVIACDCNMTNLTRTYTQVTNELQDAFRTQGWGLGHTFVIPRGFDIISDINLPFQRIDYLFHSSELGVRSIWVISKESGSDHRPLMAKFVFR